MMARKWLKEQSRQVWWKRFLGFLNVRRRKRPRGLALVGTELKRIFSAFWLVVTPECLCAKRAELLDVLGPRWARQNSAIVVDWLQEEFEKRAGRAVGLKDERVNATPERQAEIDMELCKLGGKMLNLPFSRIVAGRIVWIAIKRAERRKL